MDTKKKELLGQLHRPGQCYSTDVQCVYDHDFRHLANGLLVPHGVYDYFDNAGFMTLGTSRETSAFVCDAIALAWEEDRQAHYPDAEEILLTFDAGGANGYSVTGAVAGPPTERSVADAAATVPPGVDTAADLEAVRAIIEGAA